MISDSIKQRLKQLEQIINNNTSNTQPIFIFTKDVGEQGYKIQDKDLHYFKDIKDSDKVRFNDMQDVKNFYIDNADILELSNINKPPTLLVDIVDNSHLERVLYDANKGG